MDREFIAIDFETANPNLASICQVGIAHYKDRKIFGEFSSYINPKDYFDPHNVSIHGINKETVANSPTFQEISNQLFSFLNNRIVVSHTHFDRVALNRVCNKFNINLPQCTWLDSARVARRAWSKFSKKGYGLYNVCKELGYNFNHHDALEDAKAAGHIIVSASNECNIGIEDWLKKVQQPITPRKPKTTIRVEKEGNPDGPFFGEVMVFTGKLEKPRREAAEMASIIGFKVDPRVTKNTTMLVVGDQDISRLEGHEKSSKHRKAEELILKGKSIRILGETDFLNLVSIINDNPKNF